MKKKRQRFYLVISLLIVSLLVGCGNSATDTSTTDNDEVAAPVSEKAEKVEGGVFTYPVPADLNSLNRHLEGYKEGHIILQALYDSLYYIDTDETRYYLAESYEVSDDNLSITVKLKDNLKWHDGETIDADDFIYTLKVCQDATSGSYYTSTAQINEKPISFEKIDDLTVTLNLPEVAPYYANDLGNLILLPEHIFDSDTDIKNHSANSQGIGSGPFKLKEWNKGESLVFERFDDYYLGKVPFDAVVFRIIPEKSSQEIALQNKEISVMEVNDDNMINKYKDDPDMRFWSFPEGRVNYLTTNKHSPNFGDQKARDAIAYALNKEEIVRGAYGSDNVALVADSVFGPKTLFRDGEFVDYQQDIEKAKQLAEESGLTKNKLTILYNIGRANQEESALIIQQQLANIGIDVEITGLEPTGFFAKAFSADTDFDMYLNGYPATGNPASLRFMFNIVNINLSDEQSEAWEKANSETDPAVRQELYKEVQRLAKEDGTMIPIAYPNFNMVSSKDYHGLDAIKTIPVFENYMNLYKVE